MLSILAPATNERLPALYTLDRACSCPAFVMAAFHAGKLRRLVEDLPTSKTTGVFIGLVGLAGHCRDGRAADELPGGTTVRRL